MKSCQKASIYLRGLGGRGGRNAFWQIPSLFIPLHQLFHDASSIGILFPANYYQFLWSSYFAIEGVIWSTLFLFFMMVIVSAVVGTGNFYHLCSKLRHLPPFYRLICLLFALFTPPIPRGWGKRALLLLDEGTGEVLWTCVQELIAH